MEATACEWLSQPKLYPKNNRNISHHVALCNLTCAHSVRQLPSMSGVSPLDHAQKGARTTWLQRRRVALTQALPLEQYFQLGDNGAAHHALRIWLLMQRRVCLLHMGTSSVL